MPFQISAGINISEIDLSTVVPAVSTTEGAIGGVFRWGPLDKIVLVDSEISLVSRYGKPSNFNAETWFTASSFLAYGNKLYVSRAANTTDETGVTGVLSAFANTAAVTSNIALIVKNEDDYLIKESAFDTDVQYIAKYPGSLGNSLKVSVCDGANQYSSTINLKTISGAVANTSNTNVVYTTGSNTAVVTLANSAGSDDSDTTALAQYLIDNTTIGDYIVAGNSSVGTVNLKVTGVSSVLTQNTAGTNTGIASYTVSFDQNYNLLSNTTSDTISRKWEYYNVVDRAPGQSAYVASFGNTAAQDEVHVVIVDDGGKFKGVPGTVLEVFSSVSRATDAKTENGSSNYYKTVINDTSSYVWFANDRANAVSNTASDITSSTNVVPYSARFNTGSDGADESTASLATLVTAYDKFASTEDVDVSLVLQGKARGGENGEVLANYIIDNITDARKDCLAFISPERADVVNNAGRDEANDIVTFRNSLRSTSYAVLDSGYKQVYDKYNDVFRFVPLNGDIAGLCVRTDSVRDSWWSPGGFTRGQIKNVVRLAYNPSKADRDILYKSGINPVVTFPGQGIVLFGDKTLLSKPSAFDRINVRRLFIVLEKAIAVAAKFTLFEFNDDFTRAQFRNLVEPFLRDIQGRRGIYDFKVVCDSTNNTGEVIDRNEFVGDIYIKPARSINFIQLNFAAVRSGVEFSEIVGQF